jgi:hypothetical protein
MAGSVTRRPSNPPFGIEALTRPAESVADQLNDRQQDFNNLPRGVRCNWHD